MCYKYQALKFEWVRKKAAANARKHGVSFEEAATCFEDPSACYLRDEAPFVVHAEVGRAAIRIISARKASPAQRRIYDEELD